VGVGSVCGAVFGAITSVPMVDGSWVIGVNLTAGCRYPGQCDPLRCVIQFTESDVIATAAALPVIIRRRQQQTPAAGKLMLRRLLRMLTAFRHCLLTWRASAYIVARIQTHPDRVCPHRTADRQTDAPDLRRTGGYCCSCTCYHGALHARRPLAR